LLRSACLTLHARTGWAISVLHDAHAIRECEEHGWAMDRADPHARERAILAVLKDPPPGISPDAAAAEVREVIASIGDTCPELCLSEIKFGHIGGEVRRGMASAQCGQRHE
jgi:hypothetical protein